MSVDSRGVHDLVAFPPGRPFLLLPLSARADFRSGLTMWTACRRTARGVLAVADRAVALVGTGPLRLLGVRTWTPPFDTEPWKEMTERWRGWFGPFDAAAVYAPRQPERIGFGMLLLRDGRPIGFCKCRPEGEWRRTDLAVLDAVASARTFEAPRVVGHLTVGGWGSVGTTPVGFPRHGPRLVHHPAAVTEEVSGALSSVLDEPEVSSHWVPMHGDMGPWNLRQVRGGRPVLFDWEHVGWGPPGADLAFHAAACAAMRIGGAELLERIDEEAAAFWAGRIPERFAGGPADRALGEAMIRVLARAGS